MIQLGISAFYHDAAACIVKDGKVIAAAEEERFTEIKHDYSFPVNAINFCLKQANINIKDVDEVCWYEIPELKKNRVLTTFKKRWLKTFLLKKKFLSDFEKNSPEKLLKSIGYEGVINYVSHHLSHAAFAYLTSPYKDADILVVDGVGEWDTVSIWKAKNKKIELVDSIQFPYSLGMFYSTMTAFLGFKPNEGEYKVMGLAPYGNPGKFYEKLKSIFEGDSTDSMSMNQKYFTWEYSEKGMFNANLAKLLELEPRLPGEEVTSEHMDLAASTQAIYEFYFLKLVSEIKQKSTSENLCLGGGCAYNGVANNKAYKYYNNIFIPFAPSDAGSAIGACLLNYEGPLSANNSPYLGEEIYSQDIPIILEQYRDKLSWLEFDDDQLYSRVSKLILNGKIVAWVQGRMEFGARALGNRSILASPHEPKMREKLNFVIKKREGFRPFAPSVLAEDVNKYFIAKDSVPYMNQVVKVKNGAKSLFPAATHVDNTARIQSVHKESNPKYYLLLSELKRHSGHGVVLNTSYNLKDQTITRTAQQAIDRYINSDIDYLVLNNYIIIKK
jgi:carbamoyltransferase